MAVFKYGNVFDGCARREEMEQAVIISGQPELDIWEHVNGTGPAQLLEMSKISYKY